MDKPVNLTAYKKKKDKAFEKKVKASIRKQVRHGKLCETKEETARLVKKIMEISKDDKRFRPIPKGFLGP